MHVAWKQIAAASSISVLLAACSSSPAAPQTIPQNPIVAQPSAAAPAGLPTPAAIAPTATLVGPGAAGVPAPVTLTAPIATMNPAQLPPATMPRPLPVPVMPLPIGPGQPIQPPAGVATQITLVVPTDTREPHQAAALPISGGTLLVSSDGKSAFAADPDRDRVSIVDLTRSLLLGTVQLQAGDEPGRLIEDSAQRVHVVLRRAGAIATIDVRTRTVTARRAVCTAPRGIGYDAASDTLKVACANGELVSLPAAAGEASGHVSVESDLRDVVVQSSGMFVSRLKSAEVLKVGADGVPENTAQPQVLSELLQQADGSLVVDTRAPNGARRMIASQEGGTLVLHQGSRNGDIPVRKPDEPGMIGSASPYGGSGSCSGVVVNAISRFDGQGKLVETMRIDGVLAVDVAQSKTGEIAVAFAGSFDPMQPFVQAINSASTDAIGPVPAMAEGEPQVLGVLQFDPAVLSKLPIAGEFSSCTPPTGGVALPAPATAVTYAGDTLVVQTREPAAVFVVDRNNQINGGAPTRIDLGGASVYDSGHEIFHRDAGAGVACATCHIEGGDDGHVWHFVDQGPRRTQSMFVGLEGTAPFHWVGDMTDLGTLMENVFVGRMGGVHQSVQRLGALEHWLYSVKAPSALRAASDPAVARGHDLFDGAAECGKCHNGAKLTNNMTVDVGTGLPLQVPSLVGVGYRGPWIHTGCAATLRDRFNVDCGGASHGKTAQLDPTQLDDLVAYLESL